MSNQAQENTSFADNAKKEIDEQKDRSKSKQRKEAVKSAFKKTGEAILHVGDSLGQVTIKSAAVVALTVLGYYLVAQLGYGMLAGLGIIFAGGIALSYVCRGLLDSSKWHPKAFVDSLQPQAA